MLYFSDLITVNFGAPKQLILIETGAAAILNSATFLGSIFPSVPKLALISSLKTTKLTDKYLIHCGGLAH